MVVGAVRLHLSTTAVRTVPVGSRLPMLRVTRILSSTSVSRSAYLDAAVARSVIVEPDSHGLVIRNSPVDLQLEPELELEHSSLQVIVHIGPPIHGSVSDEFRAELRVAVITDRGQPAEGDDRTATGNESLSRS